MYEDLYKKLNPEQKLAVDTIEGPVMVIAGPGTGKTTILTLRIATILKKTDTPAGGILAITYTDAGVKAIRLKLRSIIGNRADEVHLHTFHGFASWIINQYQDHFIDIADFKQLTDIENHNYIVSILKQPQFASLRPTGNPDYYIEPIRSAISECKKEAIDYETVIKYAQKEIENIKNDPQNISTRGQTKGQLKADAIKTIEKCQKTILLGEIYKQYEQNKKNEKRLDYDDLIINVISALNNDQLLLRLLQEQFLYIHIDEHQDTNDSQNALILKLADFFDTPNVFIVGDEKQAIYRFQGASVSNFLKFKNKWKGVETISLSNNYRSNQSILDSVFAMIENNYEQGQYTDLRVKLKSNSKPVTENKALSIIKATDILSQEGHLIEIVRALPAQDSVAIITRTNRDLLNILGLLERSGIKASAERSVDIWTDPYATVFFDIVNYLLDPSQIESLCRTILSGLWHLKTDQAVTVINDLRAGNHSSLEERIPVLNELRRLVTTSDGISALYDIAEWSGFKEKISQKPESVEIWRAILQFAQRLLMEQQNFNVRDLIVAMVEYKKLAQTKTIKIISGSTDAKVKVMTAHGSKGLEFDHVIMPYVTESSWMKKERSNYFILPQYNSAHSIDRDEQSVKDCRRLFYVAITRARKTVSLLWNEVKEDGNIEIPLRFLSELDKASVRDVSISKSPIAIAEKDQTFTISNKRHLHLLETYTQLAKQTLINSGLSVTALNHFLNCPNQFLFQSILKIPEAPSESSEKGNAMHWAISKVWQSIISNNSSRNMENIIEILNNEVDAYFSKSLLTLFKKEALAKLLHQQIPIIANALSDHWNMDGQKSTEVNYKFESLFKLKSENVTVPLKGKLDLVVEKNDGIQVFDYKTRKHMSVNEIRGLTKSSNQAMAGGYYRQLVFYKILLQYGHKTGHGHPGTTAKGLIEPALVFLTPDAKGKCSIVSLPIKQKDIDDLLANIQRLLETVWNNQLTNQTCDDQNCQYCLLKKTIF